MYWNITQPRNLRFVRNAGLVAGRSPSKVLPAAVTGAPSLVFTLAVLIDTCEIRTVAEQIPRPPSVTRGGIA